MTVQPSSFLDAMRAKWAEYGNVGSPALDQVWLQIAETMNRQVVSPCLPRPVVPAELGAGKTTCAKLWCSMLPVDEHPGVLVVVRTIAQADEYAADINVWSGATSALAYHSDLKPRPAPAVIRLYPTLVVCHRGYELALDNLLVEEPERYEQLMQHRTSSRRLVIVDEALDQVYVARLSPENLQRVPGLVRDPRIWKRHLPALDVISSANRALLDAPMDRFRVVSAEALLATSRLTAEEADDALVALWSEVRGSKYVKPEARRIVKESLTALRRHLAAYRWTESERTHRALIGSRLLLPADAGQVILDATGALNNVYLGRPDAYEMKAMPAVRDYRAVTLHVAKTRGTGKTAMLKDGQSIIKETLDSILAHYGERARERRVLVVTDLGSEDAVRSTWAKAGFGALDVAHWNKIDGRNDWRDYDTLVVLNLPWARASLDLSTYMAVRGVELDDAGLNAPPDDVKMIRETRIAAQLAQAMGRIRLRRMTDPSGACEPCDVFVRFPHWKLLADADEIVAGVQRALAGVHVIPWEQASTRLTRSNRPSVAVETVGAALLAYARKMPPGTWEKVIDVRERIGATKHMTWFRVQSNPAVLAALAKLGARIEPRSGRRGPQLIREVR